MSRDGERSTYFASAALPVRCGGCFAGGRGIDDMRRRRRTGS
jgi:hypothetical protein